MFMYSFVRIETVTQDVSYLLIRNDKFLIYKIMKWAKHEIW